MNLSLILLFALTLSAAAQTPSVAYDVSTVKPHNPADQNMSWHTNEDGFHASNVNLKNLLANAWELRGDQVTAEPSWVDDLKWDIAAKSTELTPDQLKNLKPGQRAQMMQQLLVDRFHLKAHLETRTAPILTLVPAKGGIKLKPILLTAEEKANNPPAGGTSMRAGETNVLEAKQISLESLLANLTVNLRKTVIDKTGLPGDAIYDFTLTWAPDNGLSSNPTSDAPRLADALDEQLGLHLLQTKGPETILVIDHIEKPTAD